MKGHLMKVQKYNQPESEWVEKIRNGDANAFKYLFKKYCQPLINFACRFVHDAQKEFAEASTTLALVTGKPLPEPETIGVSYAAYLNGLGEAVGELRRYLLDSLRRNDLSRCEELLAIMDDVYSVLITMDFPDGITYGLRRTSDAVRGILEKTRGDLTLVLRQKELEEKLGQISDQKPDEF